MHMISFLLKRSRWQLVSAVLLGGLSGACMTGLLGFINSTLSGTSLAVTKLIALFFVLSAGLPAMRALSEIILVRLGQRALYSLRTELAQKILKLPYRRLEELGAHRLLCIFTNDIYNLTSLITLIPVLCMNIAVVLSCLVYMWWLSVPLFLVVVVFIVIGTLGYQISIFRSGSYFQAARQEHDGLLKHFQGLILGMKELKLHRLRRNAFLNEVLADSAGRLRKQEISALTLHAIGSSWGQSLVFILLGLIVFFSPALIHISARTMVAFSIAVLYLVGPFETIMSLAPQVNRSNVAAKKIEQFNLDLAEESQEMMLSNAIETSPNWNRLELREVTHTFVDPQDAAIFVLGPINVTLRPGELVFLTGGNASGKTTLAKVMVGLYHPAGGQILFDGVMVTDEVRDTYRQMFSAVFHDFYLFDRLLGIDTDDSDEKATEYLRELQLDGRIEICNGQISSTDLSQGQRKRLALLIALIEDRAVCVLDEVAANQDTQFKEYFYRQLLPGLRAKGKTIVVISHDDRYFDLADRLIKLENGRIVKCSEYTGSATTVRP